MSEPTSPTRWRRGSAGLLPGVPAACALAAACVLAAVCVLAAGCESAGSGVAPPAFDDTAPRLFFPTAVAVVPTPAADTLLVANSNFDRAFNAGTLLQIRQSAFDALAGGIAPLSGDAVVASGLLDSFAGNLVVTPGAQAAYVTSRDSVLLNRAPFENGVLACPVVSGRRNCSADAVRLGDMGMDDPYAVALGLVRFDGAADPELAVLVSHQSPRSRNEGAAAENARLAVIPERVARASAQPFANGAFLVDLGTDGTAALAWANQTGQVFVGGCYSRVSPSLVIPCGQHPTGARPNPVRWILTDAGSRTPLQSVDLAPLLGGGDVQDLAVSSDGRTLYAVTARPDALVAIDLPRPGDAQPRLQSLVPLANSPTRLLVLGRPDGDLVVVAAFEEDALLVADPAAGRVVSQLRPLGRQPFGLASVRRADGSDRVFVSLFGSCGVGAVDVPADRAAAAAVVGILGGCR